MCIDHSLLYQARRFATGANVHSIKTWIFCYETSEPGSERQKRYEELLRDFVATKNAVLSTRLKAKAACDRGIELRKQGTAIEEAIKRALEFTY